MVSGDLGKSVLQVGDSLHIHIPEADNTENILPVRMDLSILYEDEDILVINKAADMPVHPPLEIMIIHWRMELPGISKKKDSISSTAAFKPSGQRHHRSPDLAKNPYSAAVLSAQMKQRQIRRTYLAIVQGIAPEQGTIDAPTGAQQIPIRRKTGGFRKWGKCGHTL